MDTMTDGELLRDYAQHGTEASFREIVLRHIDLVYTAALRQTRNSPHLAEDVTQLVFSALARKASLLADHPSLRGWLFLCTRNLARRTTRSEDRRRHRETNVQLMNETSPATDYDWESLRPILDEVVSRLDTTDREAVFLRYFDKLSFVEVGRHLGIGEDAARRRLDRILERLRAQLARRGVTSTGAALGIVLSEQGVRAAPERLASGVANAALTAASGPSAATVAALAALKSLILSGSLLALVGSAGIVATGYGWFLIRQARNEATAANARNSAMVAAEGRLADLNREEAAPGSAGSPHASGLETRIAADLQLNRWREQEFAANFMLGYAPFLRSRGVTLAHVEQMQQLMRKLMADIDDLKEVARLSGVDPAADPDISAQADQLAKSFMTGAADLIGAGTLQAAQQYYAQFISGGGNSMQTSESQWVTDRLAGVFATNGIPIDAAQKGQLAQLVLGYTPNYQPGEDTSAYTLDWADLAQAANRKLPADQAAVLNSFAAEVARWKINDQVAKALDEK